ncbi:hypothetical protein FACS1894110_23770 [Spirochaetia bacterium]|nr:hypothetical protein FACS1894110_23770 [Spirochaetia bacterium]
MKTLKEYDEEYNRKGRPNKKTISLKITNKPVYYLFTTKKESDIAVSKYPSIKTKLFPLTISGKTINKRKKYYDDDDKTLETAIEKGDLDEDQYMILFKSILYDNTGTDNFVELTDEHHIGETHHFIKIDDKTQVYSVLYYLNNNQKLHDKIESTLEKTLNFDRQDFIDFFSLDKNKEWRKNASILPIVPCKYKTKRELLEAEGNTEKIKRLETHKEASRAYRERQAIKENKARAELNKDRKKRGLEKREYRKRRKYNSPEQT